MELKFPWVIIRVERAEYWRSVVVTYATSYEEAWELYKVYVRMSDYPGSPVFYGLREWSYVGVPSCSLVGKQEGKQCLY